MIQIYWCYRNGLWINCAFSWAVYVCLITCVYVWVCVCVAQFSTNGITQHLWIACISSLHTYTHTNTPSYIHSKRMNEVQQHSIEFSKIESELWTNWMKWCRIRRFFSYSFVFFYQTQPMNELTRITRFQIDGIKLFSATYIDVNVIVAYLILPLWLFVNVVNIWIIKD